MTTDTTPDHGAYETDEIPVRSLRPTDLAALVDIDASASGRRRPMYFELMIERSVEKADFQVSLAAEIDGQVVGFVLATLFYGEYGLVEPSASIDAIGVLPEFRGRRVGRALMRQLRLNLSALHIERIHTEVPWNDFELLAFFERNGFEPAARVCLEVALDPTHPEG